MTVVNGSFDVPTSVDVVQVASVDYLSATGKAYENYFTKGKVNGSGNWSVTIPGGTYVFRWLEGTTEVKKTVTVPATGTHSYASITTGSSGSTLTEDPPNSGLFRIND